MRHTLNHTSPVLCCASLQYLISKAVDPKKADYAVFTGVQVRLGWGICLQCTRGGGWGVLFCACRACKGVWLLHCQASGAELQNRPCSQGWGCTAKLQRRLPGPSLMFCQTPSSPPCHHVQIHNWSSNLEDPSIPSLEFVGVGKSYVVVNGEPAGLDTLMLPRAAVAPCWEGCPLNDRHLAAAASQKLCAARASPQCLLEP